MAIIMRGIGYNLWLSIGVVAAGAAAAASMDNWQVAAILACVGGGLLMWSAERTA